MKLVGTMLVGNEEGLVAAAIEQALAHGVDAFVIVETASRDATADVLRRYCDDPRFDITFLSEDVVFGPNPPHPYTVWEGIVDRAKSLFGADWIIRIDADEFVLVSGGDLKTLCAGANADEIQFNRVNALIPADGADPSDFVHDPELLAAVQVVSRPFPNDVVRLGQNEDVPLILTHVAPRAIARAAAITRFDAGGHRGVDEAGQVLASEPTNAAWIVHFWFTTEARFAGKARFLRDITSSVRKLTPGGWQWNRWAAQADQDTAAIAAEYQRQVVDDATRAELLRQGRVTRADQVDPARFGSTADEAARDLRRLGFATDPAEAAD
ncbi:glycosyltransferase family 2 protein [uncultured Tateyamaria sp.]|uniref:glycosyltransferase family 2 protein n=1 Tax=Tateyamaria sp. 1078 TaxID=3417464 RepID=UPI002631A267|nr:glycosyltransferase family 2 protein [uncultured Tateyamaria sp.]